MTVPYPYYLRNKMVYDLLVSNLKELGLGIHLKDIDIFQLVEVANTIDMLENSTNNWLKMVQLKRLLQGKGYCISQAVSARNTTLNTLQILLRALQLEPQSRRLLQSAVLNDVIWLLIQVKKMMMDCSIQF